MVWLMSRGKRNLHHCIWIRLWVWDKNASDLEHLLSYGCSADARRKVLTLSDYGPHDWMGEHSEKACSFYSSEVTLSTIGKPVFTPKKNVKCKFKRSWEIIPLHLCLRLKLKLNQWFFFLNLALWHKPRINPVIWQSGICPSDFKDVWITIWDVLIGLTRPTGEANQILATWWHRI